MSDWRNRAKMPPVTLAVAPLPSTGENKKTYILHLVIRRKKMGHQHSDATLQLSCPFRSSLERVIRSTHPVMGACSRDWSIQRHPKQSN